VLLKVVLVTTPLYLLGFIHLHPTKSKVDEKTQNSILHQTNIFKRNEESTVKVDQPLQNGIMYHHADAPALLFWYAQDAL
jgi:hypothetical protein